TASLRDLQNRLKRSDQPGVHCGIKRLLCRLTPILDALYLISNPSKFACQGTAHDESILSPIVSKNVCCCRDGFPAAGAIRGKSRCQQQTECCCDWCRWKRVVRS